MATTHQRGYVTTRGKQWYGYYRKVVNDPATNEQKTVRVPVNLGLKSKMNKTRPVKRWNARLQNNWVKLVLPLES